MNKIRLTVALLGLCLLFLTGQGSPQRRHRVKHPANKTSARVATGVWGGPHVRLQVSDNGGEIEYDCAHGTIAQPLVLDAQGHFSVAGTHDQSSRPPPWCHRSASQRFQLQVRAISVSCRSLTCSMNKVL